MKYSEKNRLLYVFVVFILFGVLACKKNDKEDEITPDESFDKSGMVANYADKIILPAYSGFKTKIDSLHFSATQFVANPSISTLTDLRLIFFNAYTAYQWISTYEFGPAENDVIRANFNTFPCDTTQINNNISTGIYDLSAVSNIDAKGFPALDFLLFRSKQNDAYIISLFTSVSSATNAKNYLQALVNELKTKTDALNTVWSATGGNYISSFKSSTGSDVGSSIGMLVNQLNFDFELLKNARIGIPLGKKTLGIPLPEKAEAFYSQKSIALAIEHIKSIENIYLGRDRQNIDGLGLDDYLAHLNVQYTSGLLSEAIKNKFISVKAKLTTIPDPLSVAVVNNTTLVDQVYMELQQLVILLKVDMPSALGVLITYQDNDGD